METVTRPVAEKGVVLLEADDVRVRRVPGPVYVANLLDYFSLDVMARVLEAAWADPEWAQPWGLVMVVERDVGYDTDLRHHAMPPADKRAVGTAIVSNKTAHRMVVSSIGIGMRIIQGFHLTSFATEQEGIDDQREAVERTRAAGRLY